MQALVFLILALCTFGATVRLSIPQAIDTKVFQDGVLRYVTHPGWCVALLVFAPLVIGEFAREQASPLPWVAFAEEYGDHGLINGLLSLVMVTTIDLWIFWTIGQITLNDHSDPDKTTKWAVRAANFLLGLVLVTPQNPILQIIGAVAN